MVHHVNRRRLWIRSAIGWVLIPAVAALLAGCGESRPQLQTSPLLQSLQRKVGLIGYLGPDGNVYSINQSGGRETPLTEDAGTNAAARTRVNYSQPTWAPDGRRIAFARVAITNQRTLRTSILVANGRRGEVREVFSTNTLSPIYLYWAPDSSQITLLSQPLGSVELELGLIDVDQDVYRPLDHGQPYYWNWLPDNSALVAHVGGDTRVNAGARLSLVPVDPRRSKSDFNLAPAGFQAPAVSPDGRYLAYVTTGGGGTDLVARELDGPDEQVLTSVPGFAYFAYAPRGSKIAVMKSASPQPSADGQLVIIDTRSGREIALPDGDVIAFFWSPNGQRIAYLVPARPDADQGLTLDPLFARQQGLLYVELRVVDASGGNSWRVVQFPVSRGLLQLHLPFFDQYLRSASIWSPNSRYVTYSAFASNGSPGVFVSAVTGLLRPQFVAAGDFAFWSR